METQLEMLGILYSVALRAENGVRNVTQFFNTFQKPLQEINKSQIRIERSFPYTKLKNASIPFIELAGILDLAFVGLAAVSWFRNGHGGWFPQTILQKSDASGVTESNLNLWLWSLRVTTMWMSTTTRHWDS